MSVRCRRTIAGRLAGAAAALLLALTAAPPVVAQPMPQPGTSAVPLEQIDALWPKLTPKQQFAVAEQMIASARYTHATRLLRATAYAHSGDRLVQSFWLAMAAKGEGRLQEAADRFRAILASSPGYARVRLELAHTLFAMKEDESARHHFELALGAAGTQPGLDQTVRSYLNAIDGRKRWDVTGFVTLAPSTNINQGATTKAVTVNGLPFEIAERNRRKSGIGVTGGFQAGYRQPLADGLDLVLAGGAQGKRYRERDFNDGLVNLSIGPRWRFGSGFLGIYATGDHRWLADDAYSSSYGGLVSAGVQLGPRDMLFADVGCSRRRYSIDWRDTDLSHQDGHLCYLASRYEHHLDSRTFVRALANLGREDATLDHLDSRTWAGGLGLYREIPWGISLYLQALYSSIDFKGLYPGFAEAREDRRWDLSVNLTKRDLQVFGFAPMLQYTYTTNDSNIPFHAYDAHGVNLTLTKRF